LDHRARGIEAATLMARTLRGEVRPTMAAAFPPLAINIVSQGTYEEPCRSLYALADEVLRRPGVLSNSLLLGFPYADVAEMGAAAIVVTDTDVQGAQRCADELAQQWWERRLRFIPDLIGVEDAVLRAMRVSGPVCLLDMGDNVGGGSPGDGTLLAHALIDHGVRSFVCLADADSVRRAQEAGHGARLRLAMGGKSDALHGSPVEAEVTVLALTDGKFEERDARHGGYTAFDQGPTAIVESGDGLTVMLTTRRMAPFSLAQLTTAGVEPSAFQVIVAKGVHAPVSAYTPVCRQFIRVDTPGVTSADLWRFEYRHRRRPMFPFEREASFHAGPPD
jgi:microcystin degradation protein MlrC